MIFPKLHRHELLELGMKYKLVTPGTSLMVLETLDQYVEHGIRPPVSRPEMRREYDLTLRRAADAEQLAEQRKLQTVREEWRFLLEWWRTSFPSEGYVRDRAS